MLRSTSITKARLFQHSDVETWIRWYRVPDDAPALPGITAFGHPTWEPEPNDFEGAGVKLEGAVWRPAAYPLPDPPYTPIGTGDDFLFGLLPDTVPQETGCGGQGVEAFGGFNLDGSAFPVHGLIVGGSHAGDRIRLRVKVVATITGGAVTSATISQNRRSGVVIGGGIPATSSPPSPTYIVSSSIVAGATVSASRGAGGAYAPEEYSAAWDRPH